MASERERLQFIERRDGVEGARRFAAQTLAIYRRSVLKTGRHNRPFHFASVAPYRERFIRSYLELKCYLHTTQSS